MSGFIANLFCIIICVVISEYFISEKNIPILLKCDELKKPIYLEFALNDIFQKDLFSVHGSDWNTDLVHTSFMLLAKEFST